MEFDMLESYIGTSCLTSCIRNDLLFKGHDSEEALIFCNDDMLRIECETSCDSLFSPMFTLKMIKQICKKKGIKLIEIDRKIDEISLKRYLDKYESIILNVDCRYLDYSSNFKKTVSKQHFHYINILKYNNGKFLINDSFIPSTTKKKFLGWISFEDQVYETCRLYVVQVEKLIFPQEENIRQDIVTSIENYFDNKINENAFNYFIKNIYDLKLINDKNKKRSILLEMATTISIGGVKSSRKFLGNLIKMCRIFKGKDNHVNRAIEELIENYTILSVLLLKSMHTLKDEDLYCVVQKIMSIRKSECSIFTKLSIDMYKGEKINEEFI